MVLWYILFIKYQSVYNIILCSYYVYQLNDELHTLYTHNTNISEINIIENKDDGDILKAIYY